MMICRETPALRHRWQQAINKITPAGFTEYRIDDRGRKRLKEWKMSVGQPTAGHRTHRYRKQYSH